MNFIKKTLGHGDKEEIDLTDLYASSTNNFGKLAQANIINSGLAERMGVRFHIPSEPDEMKIKIPPYWRLPVKGKGNKTRRVKGKVKFKQIFQQTFLSLPTWIRGAKMKERDFHKELEAAFSHDDITRRGQTHSYRRSFVATIWEMTSNVLLSACVVREVPIFQRSGRRKDGKGKRGIDPIPVWEIWMMTERGAGLEQDETTLFKLIQALACAAKIDAIICLSSPDNIEWWLSQTPMIGCSICKHLVYHYDEVKLMNENGSDHLKSLLNKFQLRQKPAAIVKQFYNYHDSTGLAEFAPYRFRPYDAIHVWFFTRILPPSQGISAGGEADWLEIETKKKKIEKSWIGAAGIGTKGSDRMAASGYTTNGFGGSRKKHRDNYVGGRHSRKNVKSHFDRLQRFGIPDDDRFQKAGKRYRGVRADRRNCIRSDVSWSLPNMSVKSESRLYYNNSKRNKIDGFIEETGKSGGVTEDKLTWSDALRVKQIGPQKGPSSLSRGSLGGGYIVDFEEHLVVETTLKKVKRVKKTKKSKKKKRRYKEKHSRTLDSIDTFNVSQKMQLPKRYRPQKQQHKPKSMRHISFQHQPKPIRHISFQLPSETPRKRKESKKLYMPPAPPITSAKYSPGADIRGRKRRSMGSGFLHMPNSLIRGGAGQFGDPLYHKRYYDNNQLQRSLGQTTTFHNSKTSKYKPKRPRNFLPNI